MLTSCKNKVVEYFETETLTLHYIDKGLKENSTVLHVTVLTTSEEGTSPLVFDDTINDGKLYVLRFR